MNPRLNCFKRTFTLPHKRNEKTFRCGLPPELKAKKHAGRVVQVKKGAIAPQADGTPRFLAEFRRNRRIPLIIIALIFLPPLIFVAIAICLDSIFHFF